MAEKSRGMEEMVGAESSEPMDSRAGAGSKDDPTPPVPHVRTYVAQVVERVLRDAPGHS